MKAKRKPLVMKEIERLNLKLADVEYKNELLQSQNKKLREERNNLEKGFLNYAPIEIAKKYLSSNK